MAKRKGVVRRCPGCGARLHAIQTDWHYLDMRIGDHQVATMGSTWNCPDDLVSTVEFQMASNRAAYTLDYDYELNLGFLGTAWVQCPKKRKNVTGVCWAL